MPEYFLDQTHATALENDFVVAWWEQRGAGLSFSAGIPAGRSRGGSRRSRTKSLPPA